VLIVFFVFFDFANQSQINHKKKKKKKKKKQRNAHLCLLSGNCSEAAYTKLVKALCEEHQIHLVMVPDGKTLGEWAGLCKVDKEGNARKVVGASCVVVKDYGPESPALTFLMEHLKSGGN
jgi:small subunit ribosomal protein S12e